MIGEIVGALFLSRKAHHLKQSPALQRLDREREAEHEAFMLGLHDMNVEFYGRVFPTFRHRHDQARARREL